MYDKNIFDSDSNGGLSEETELVLIGAMMDGFVREFELRGLKLRRVGSSMEVTNKAGQPLGGYVLMDSVSVEFVHEWVKAKAEYYG